MYNHARIEHNKKGENSHGSAFLPRSEVRELLYEQVLPAQQTESFRLPFSHAFFLIHFYLCRQIKNGSPITRAGALRSGDHFLCLFDCWTIKTDCHASVATLARNVILRSKNRLYVNSWGRAKRRNLIQRSMWQATCSFVLGAMRHNGESCCGSGRSCEHRSKRV